MTKKKAAGNIRNSFSDFAEAYEAMTSATNAQQAFSEPNGLYVNGIGEEPEQREMPDAMEAVKAAKASIVALTQCAKDTRLEESAARIAWGIANAFHHEAQRLAVEEDRLAMQLGDMARVADTSEVFVHELEELQARCQSVETNREAVECMRDNATVAYTAATGRPWMATRGSRVASASTASQIAARDYLAARRSKWIENHNPTGPVVIVSGPADWHDIDAIYSRLDNIKTRVPHMTLITTGQRKGADLIAAGWAAANNVPLVIYGLDRARGNGAGFFRNRKLASLKPVEAIICQGSTIQEDLAVKLRSENVPCHLIRKDQQKPLPEDVERAIRRKM